MAIGDCFAVFLGTATSTRQPASGVFEQVSAMIIGGSADVINAYDGSNVVQWVTAAVRTDVPDADTGGFAAKPYNMAIMLGNTVYVQKAGTTDRIQLSGVQVDA